MNAGIQLAQSPTARMLLDLAERRADGSLELGGRRVTLRGGDVVDVSGRPGDPTLDGLLVSAGALDGEAADWACARAIADGRALAEVLRERLPDATIGGALREAWTERLAAAFRDEAQGTPREGEAPDTSEAPASPGRPSRGGPVFLPEAVLPSAAEGDCEPGESTVALVLDALAVRAEADLRREGGEAAVAALSVLELVWERTPHQVSAARWCGLGLDDDAGEDEAPRAAKHLDDGEGPGEPGRAARASADALDLDSDAEDAAVDAPGARLPGPIAVGPVLDRFPEVAPRVAAVVRAGLARLRPRGSGAPTPPPRPPSLVSASAGGASPIPPSRRRPSLPALPSSPRDSLEADPLAPGLADPPVPPVLPNTLHRFQEVDGGLDDPLDAVEARIREAEESDAPGPTRAEAWRQAARLWQSHHRSLEEASRAFREAAAADPEEPETLAQTALLCIAAARPDAAKAYARAAATVAAGQPSEARVQELVARLAWRRGDLREAAGAYRRALTADPEDPEPAESLAWLLWALGDDEQAVAVTRLAASRQADTDEGRERARSLLATAFLERPDDPGLARDYAAVLAREDRHEAAVAVLGYAARQLPSGEARQSLLLAAAERAEAAALPSVAAASLLLAFDEEAGLEAIYEPLLDDLEAAGAILDRALVLEEMAFAIDPAQREARGRWLLRAAEARGELPGPPTWALELAIRALAHDPRSEEALERVGELSDASGDPGRLPEALEAAFVRGVSLGADREDPAAFDALLRSLAHHAETRLGSARRALRCWQRLAARHPDDPSIFGEVKRLEGPAHAEETRLGRAEAELARAPEGPSRIRALRRVVALSRDAPEQRERARRLLEEILRDQPQDGASATLLEQLHLVEGDDARTIAHLRSRLPHAPAPERRRLSHLLAALEAARGRFRESAEAALQALQDDPNDAEASARLERAGRRLGDSTLLRRALRARARNTEWVAERVGRSVRLAELLEADGAFDDAWRTLAEALEDSPPPPEALLFAAPRLDALPPETAQRAIAAARHVFGDSAHLLAHIVDGTGDLEDEVREEAFARWAALAPRDPERAARWLAWCTRQATDPGVLREAVVAALATPGAESASSLRLAIERLAALPAVELAAGVALEALDRLGDRDPAWSALALDLAEASGKDDLVLGALERMVCRQRGAEKVGTLSRIADLHRDRGSPGREARALLRILAVAPGDRGALERLTDLYARAGEANRLLAVLALRLEGARDPAERRERLLDLAAACAHQGDDPDRAAEYLSVVADEAGDDEGVVGLVAGGLGALGRPRTAYDLLVTRARERALRPGSGDDPGERARALRASGYLFERAVHVAEHDLADPSLALESALEGLSRAPSRTGLLLAFERLALHLGNVATAKETYARLVERAMGPHGRRSLLYREARWLERAGDPRGALEAYRWAFALAPTHGVVYKALVRLAGELGSWEDVVDAATRLSDRSPSAAAYAAHRREAAEASERRLADPERAFELLVEAWERAPSPELEGEARRLAGVVAALDPAGTVARPASARAGASSSAPGAPALPEPGPHPAIARVARVLRERAMNALEPADRVAGLERLAAFYAQDLGMVDQAAVVIDEALELAETTSLPGEHHADLHCVLAEWLGEHGRLDDAQGQLHAALEAAPNHGRALALLELFAARTGRRSVISREAAAEALPDWPEDPPGEDPLVRTDPPFADPGSPDRGTTSAAAAAAARRQETWGTSLPSNAAGRPPAPGDTGARGPSLGASRGGEPLDGDADSVDLVDPDDADVLLASRSRTADPPPSQGPEEAGRRERRSSGPGALPWVLTEAPPEVASGDEDDLDAGASSPTPRDGRVFPSDRGYPATPGGADDDDDERPTPTSSSPVPRDSRPVPSGTARRAGEIDDDAEPPVLDDHGDGAELILDEDIVEDAKLIPDDAGEDAGLGLDDDDPTPRPGELGAPSAPSGMAPRGRGAARTDQSGLRLARPSSAAPIPPPVGAPPVGAPTAGRSTLPPPPGIVDPGPHPAGGSDGPSFDSGRPSAVFTPVPSEHAPPREDEDTNEAMLRGAVARGDLDAAERLSLRLATQPGRLHDAAPLLRSVVRKDPGRVRVLRTLQDVSERLRDETVADVVTEVLSVFDPAVRAPSRTPGEGFGALVEEAGDLLVDPRLLAPLSALRLAWDGATPLFRTTLGERGLVGTDRLSPLGPSPLARALREAQETLRVGELDAFRKAPAPGEAAVQVLRTVPPAVLVSPELDAEAEAEPDGEGILRFRVARAVALTKAEHVLLGTLDESAGATLLHGLRAAFGPPGDGDSPEREAKALASELWRTIPSREQTRMRALLEETGDDRFTYARLRGEVLAAAARAGLLVSGSVRAALRGLSRDEPGLRAHALDTERDWVRACAGSGSLRALVGLALSDAYLDARRRWERRRESG